jgi:hypothetical protein
VTIGRLRVETSTTPSEDSWTLIANLSAFQKSHHVANPEPDDFEPDGTWWGMVAKEGLLFAVEPNHGDWF